MKKSHKIILIISICLNLIVLVIGIKLVAYKGGIKYIALVGENFLKSGKVVSASTTAIAKVDGFSKYTSTENDIIFLGDSITEGGAWNEYFPGISARNRGIGGDRTYHILNRLDQVALGKPKKIFLSVGINDLIGKVKDKEILDNYKQIINVVKLKTPETKLYIESILPINKETTKEILEKKGTAVVSITNIDIKSMNAQINELCVRAGVQYINCYDQLLDSQGELKKELTSDGLHLNQDGYLVLSKVIGEYVTAQ